MNRTSDDAFRALRPAAFDRLAAEAYARRRADDLGRAFAVVVGDAEGTASVPGGRRRRRTGGRARRAPRLLVAGIAAGAVAAATYGVIVGGSADRTGGTGGPAGRPTPGPASRTPQDARAFLLASADSAAKAPARIGAYWYVRERDTELIGSDKSPGAPNKATLEKLRREGRLRPGPSIAAYVSRTQETWSGRNLHDRTITGIDRKIAFVSPADEARWKAKGSPELEPWSAGRQVHDYDFSHLAMPKAQKEEQINAQLKLPTSTAALAKVLRHWRDDKDAQAGTIDGRSTPFPLFVFWTAQDLLTGPITPGTRAALYRVLAVQPGITSLGTTTDRMGRKGVMLAMAALPGHEGPDGEIRLLIDPATGQLLEERDGDRRSPSDVRTYQVTGWVNHLGERP